MLFSNTLYRHDLHDSMHMQFTTVATSKIFLLRYIHHFVTLSKKFQSVYSNISSLSSLLMYTGLQYLLIYLAIHATRKEQLSNPSLLHRLFIQESKAACSLMIPIKIKVNEFEKLPWRNKWLDKQPAMPQNNCDIRQGNEWPGLTSCWTGHTLGLKISYREN